MAGGGYRVDGLARTLRQLKALGLEVDDLKAAFAAIAQEAADAITGRVPRKTGRLAGTVRGNRAQSKAVVRAGRAAVPYAGPINYGWPKRGIAPALFMQQGEQDYTPQAVTRLEEELETQIRRKGLR